MYLIIDLDNDQWAVACVRAGVWHRFYGACPQLSGDRVLPVRSQFAESACRSRSHVSEQVPTASEWYVCVTVILATIISRECAPIGTTFQKTVYTLLQLRNRCPVVYQYYYYNIIYTVDVTNRERIKIGSIPGGGVKSIWIVYLRKGTKYIQNRLWFACW